MPEYEKIGPNTWVETLPLLLVILENSNRKGRAFARKELTRMAQIADKAVADANAD